MPVYRNRLKIKKRAVKPGAEPVPAHVEPLPEIRHRPSLPDIRLRLRNDGGRRRWRRSALRLWREKKMYK